MKYTNRHNIPQEIINAVHNDSYSKGKATISATGLLQPPRIRLLAQENYEKLTIDVSDEIWKLLGQSVHTILERANENNEDVITEQRMFTVVNDWTVSGQTDSIDVKSNTLKDYKVTSVWSIVSALKEGKVEWEQQLNIYAYLYQQTTGKTIDQLNIIAIARDWNKNQYLRSGGDYPPSPVTVLDIDLWSDEEQEDFIKQRVSIHQEAEVDYLINDKLPFCTDEERWRRKDTYRVEKKGRKTAVRVLDTQEEADEYVEGHKDSKLLKVVEAKGECVRCANYCDVAEFCNQYNEESK
jgi:hypothetical protein|tara:strand:- start:389 stop:1276 length:888 start_codon:yes stop_codon:yes gene_type:complete